MKKKYSSKLLWKMFNWSVGMSAMNVLAVYLNRAANIPAPLLLFWGFLLLVIFISGIALMFTELTKLFNNEWIYSLIVSAIFFLAETAVFVTVLHEQS